MKFSLDWLRQYKLARPLIQTIKAVPLNDLVLRAGRKRLIVARRKP